MLPIKLKRFSILTMPKSELIYFLQSIIHGYNRLQILVAQKVLLLCLKRPYNSMYSASDAIDFGSITQIA